MVLLFAQATRFMRLQLTDSHTYHTEISAGPQAFGPVFNAKKFLDESKNFFRYETF